MEGTPEQLDVLYQDLNALEEKKKLFAGEAFLRWISAMAKSGVMQLRSSADFPPVFDEQTRAYFLNHSRDSQFSSGYALSIDQVNGLLDCWIEEYKKDNTFYMKTTLSKDEARAKLIELMHQIEMPDKFIWKFEEGSPHKYSVTLPSFICSFDNGIKRGVVIPNDIAEALDSTELVKCWRATAKKLNEDFYYKQTKRNKEAAQAFHPMTTKVDTVKGGVASLKDIQKIAAKGMLKQWLITLDPERKETLKQPDYYTIQTSKECVGINKNIYHYLVGAEIAEIVKMHNQENKNLSDHDFQKHLAKEKMKEKLLGFDPDHTKIFAQVSPYTIDCETDYVSFNLESSIVSYLSKDEVSQICGEHNLITNTKLRNKEKTSMTREELVIKLEQFAVQCADIFARPSHHLNDHTIEMNNPASVRMVLNGEKLAPTLEITNSYSYSVEELQEIWDDCVMKMGENYPAQIRSFERQIAKSTSPIDKHVMEKDKANYMERFEEVKKTVAENQEVDKKKEQAIKDVEYAISSLLATNYEFLHDKTWCEFSFLVQDSSIALAINRDKCTGWIVTNLYDVTPDKIQTILEAQVKKLHVSFAEDLKNTLKELERTTTPLERARLEKDIQNRTNFIQSRQSSKLINFLLTTRHAVKDNIRSSSLERKDFPVPHINGGIYNGLVFTINGVEIQVPRYLSEPFCGSSNIRLEQLKESVKNLFVTEPVQADIITPWIEANAAWIGEYPWAKFTVIKNDQGVSIAMNDVAITPFTKVENLDTFDLVAAQTALDCSIMGGNYGENYPLKLETLLKRKKEVDEKHSRAENLDTRIGETQTAITMEAKTAFLAFVKPLITPEVRAGMYFQQQPRKPSDFDERLTLCYDLIYNNGVAKTTFPVPAYLTSAISYHQIAAMTGLEIKKPLTAAEEILAEEDKRMLEVMFKPNETKKNGVLLIDNLTQMTKEEIKRYHAKQSLLHYLAMIDESHNYDFSYENLYGVFEFHVKEKGFSWNIEETIANELSRDEVRALLAEYKQNREFKVIGAKGFSDPKLVDTMDWNVVLSKHHFTSMSIADIKKELTKSIESGELDLTIPWQKQIGPNVTTVLLEEDIQATIDEVKGKYLLNSDGSIYENEAGSIVLKPSKKQAKRELYQLALTNNPNLQPVSKDVLSVYYTQTLTDEEMEAVFKEVDTGIVNPLNHSFFEAFKLDTKKSLYNASATLSTSLLRQAIVNFLTLQSYDSSLIRAVESVMDTEVGLSFLQSGVGYLLTYSPGLEKNKQAEKWAEVFRQKGAETLFTASGQSLMDLFLPMMNQVKDLLPGEDGIIATEAINKAKQLLAPKKIRVTSSSKKRVKAPKKEVLEEEVDEPEVEESKKMMK